jgi:hypothetical protein
MANNTHKEQWIDEVLTSTQGMKRAQPHDGLYDNLFSKLNSSQTDVISFPVRQWVAAAILLLALNIGSVIYFTNREASTEIDANNNPLAMQLPSSTYNY